MMMMMMMAMVMMMMMMMERKEMTAERGVRAPEQETRARHHHLPARR